MSETIPDAPTTLEDGSPMPKFRLALTMLVDSHGVDAHDAITRALIALRAPSGPFHESVDHVSGSGLKWTCHADVVYVNCLLSRKIDE